MRIYGGNILKLPESRQVCLLVVGKSIALVLLRLVFC